MQSAAIAHWMIVPTLPDLSLCPPLLDSHAAIACASTQVRRGLLVDLFVPSSNGSTAQVNESPSPYRPLGAAQ